MFKTTPLDLSGRCLRCLMRTPICMCPDIPEVRTRARFVILRHSLEAMKPTNTARIAHLA
ncbi:MAG: DTW domain-containing protein, partial [Myxococcaceae bacterium]